MRSDERRIIMRTSVAEDTGNMGAFTRNGRRAIGVEAGSLSYENRRGSMNQGPQGRRTNISFEDTHSILEAIRRRRKDVRPRPDAAAA